MTDDNTMPESQQPNNRQIKSEDSAAADAATTPVPESHDGDNKEAGCWIKLQNVDNVVSIVAGLFAIIGGVYAFLQWSGGFSVTPDRTATIAITTTIAVNESPSVPATEADSSETPRPTPSGTLEAQVENLLAERNLPIDSGLTTFAAEHVRYLAGLSRPELNTNNLCDLTHNRFTQRPTLYPDDLVFLVVSATSADANALAIDDVRTLFNQLPDNVRFMSAGYVYETPFFQHLVVVLATPDRPAAVLSCYGQVNLPD